MIPLNSIRDGFLFLTISRQLFEVFVVSPSRRDIPDHVPVTVYELGLSYCQTTAVYMHQRINGNSASSYIKRCDVVFVLMRCGTRFQLASQQH
jgi:hypothetical protein